MFKILTALIIMGVTVGVPPIFATGDGVKGAVQIIGSDQGGRDLAIDLGSANRAVTVKRDGTLLDAGDAVEGLADAGSTIIAQSFGLNTSLLTGNYALIDSVTGFVMVNLPLAKTITGLKFFQFTQGVYTANNTNQVGLYSYDNGTGTLTLIASSTNNGNLWKNAVGLHTEAFSSTVDLSAGIYWMAFLFNSSATTTTPAIASGALTAAVYIASLDLPNSGLTYANYNPGHTALPANITMSTLAPMQARPWFALY